MLLLREKTELEGIICNSEHLYLGNLVKYWEKLLRYAKNLNLPSHNLRHIEHVLWACYQACKFYKEILSPRDMRNILIATIFHDWNHLGGKGKDIWNIDRALAALGKHILPKDRSHLATIVFLIKMTEVPYRITASKLPLSAMILREADLSQSLSDDWMHQVIHGFGKEWCVKPIEVLKIQEEFLKNKLELHSEWAKTELAPLVATRIQEVRTMLAIVGNKIQPSSIF